jgi:hypothetical protein
MFKKLLKGLFSTSSKEKQKDRILAQYHSAEAKLDKEMEEDSEKSLKKLSDKYKGTKYEKFFNY